jgi:metal-responsive CopG/Arc/MetJ family transcriptional regulator
MQTISLKIDDKLLKEVDSKLKDLRYSTRTEFIREAIRDKLKEEDKQRALKWLDRVYGASKRKTTDEQLEKVREKISEELLKDLD